MSLLSLHQGKETLAWCHVSTTKLGISEPILFGTAIYFIVCLPVHTRIGTEIIL